MFGLIEYAHGWYWNVNFEFRKIKKYALTLCKGVQIHMQNNLHIAQSARSWAIKRRLNCVAFQIHQYCQSSTCLFA
jgi:hypothetical protein